MFNVTFEEDVEQQDILDRMDALGHPEALVQQVGINNYFIRTTVLEEAVGDGLSEREIIERDLEETLGLDRQQIEVESVSPIVAAETVNIAFYALAAASVFILLYVWYAFRRVPRAYRSGVSAVLALVHDVLVILGVFSILGRVIGFEVNSMFIVGLLIVAGYSVNDTIVVFDRIRENVQRHPDRDLGGLVNLSIMETMGRSLNTSLTTLFVLVAMLLIGGPSIRELAAGAGHRRGGGDLQQHLRRQPVPRDVGPWGDPQVRAGAPDRRHRRFHADGVVRQSSYASDVPLAARRRGPIGTMSAVGHG